MSATARLALDRTNRNAAHRVFAERLGRIKADIEARGVGSRVASTVMEGTSDAIDAGLHAARERKAVIAGTIGALLLWVFRQPLFDTATTLLARFQGDDDDDEIRDENA